MTNSPFCNQLVTLHRNLGMQGATRILGGASTSEVTRLMSGASSPSENEIKRVNCASDVLATASRRVGGAKAASWMVHGAVGDMTPVVAIGVNHFDEVRHAVWNDNLSVS